jgi:hypothetical protein
MKQTTSWFDSFNSLVLKRYDGEYFSMDMLDPQAISTAYAWVHKKSIKEVEELSQPFLFIQSMIQQPMAIAYLDNSEASLRLVNEILPEVAKAVYKGMIICYTDINSSFGPSRK